jgi:predicted N-formylglutamate amidohydrolase
MIAGAMHDVPADSHAPDTEACDRPAAGPLLAADEPAPAWVYNPAGRSALLLVCDHADNFVPRALGRLGLHEAAFERHIAYDIGIAPVTRMLADAFDAPAVFSHFSRLIVDPNRQLDDPTLVPAISDDTPVPANRALDAAGLDARLQAFFWPYHRTVAAQIDRMQADGRCPVLLSMHSFTPVLRGRARPWEVGVLWDDDARLPVPLMQALAARGWTVGDNEPYSGRDGHGYTQHVHGDRRGLANALMEIRQDLIDTRKGQSAWAGEMAAALRGPLDDPELYQARLRGA